MAVNLNAPVKCVVALLIIAICVGVFYFADWQGKMEDIERVVKENESLTAELADKRKQIEELPRLTKEKQELEAELARVVQTNLVPEKAEMFVANYLKEIEKLFTEESYRTGDKSLEILSITPGALTQKNSEGSEGESSEDGEGGYSGRYMYPYSYDGGMSYRDGNSYGSSAAYYIAEYLHIEQPTAYKRKNRALDRLTVLLFGKS